MSRCLRRCAPPWAKIRRPARVRLPGHEDRRTYLPLLNRSGPRAEAARKSRPGCWAPVHAARSRRHSSCSDAQVLAFDWRASASSTVGVFSTARRRRNQEVSEMRRAVSGDASPRSSATMPKPPPCDQQIRRLSRRARHHVGTTQIRRSRRTPAAAAEAGSKASSASTSAQTSRAVVACSQDGEQQAGAAGGRRSEDFGEAAARQSAGGRVEGSNAGRDALGRGAGLPVEVSTENGLELRLKRGSRHFAFYSPSLYFYRKS